MRALPADLSEYLGSMALGKTVFPTLPGAGAAVVAGATVASAPHCALRKSFHFMPLRVPAALASLYCFARPPTRASAVVQVLGSRRARRRCAQCGRWSASC
jgi:hypothetical protein